VKEEGKYVCPYCGKVFKTKQALGGHIRMKHRDEAKKKKEEVKVEKEEVEEKKEEDTANEEDDEIEETQTASTQPTTAPQPQVVSTPTTAPVQQYYYYPQPTTAYPYPAQTYPQQQGITFRDIVALANSPAVSKIIDKVVNNKSDDPLMSLVYQYMVKSFTEKLEKSDKYEDLFLDLVGRLTSAFSTNTSKAYSKGLEEYFKQLGKAKGAKDAQKLTEEEEEQIDPFTALLTELQSLKKDIRKLKKSKKKAKKKAESLVQQVQAEAPQALQQQTETQSNITNENKKLPGVFVE